MARAGVNIIEMLSNIELDQTILLDITTKHPQYDKFAPIWKKCRDAVGGQEEIKEAGREYLFQLNGQSDAQYTNYLNRSQWFDATSRTRQSYLGMTFRKSPQVFYKDDIKEENTPPKDFFDTITSEGKSLTEFIHDVTEEVITVNRCGVMVNFPTNEEAINAISEYEYEEIIKSKEIRPVMEMYKAEDRKSVV